jgi:type III secretory pathway component EscU
MEFITTDSKLTIDGNTIVQKTLIEINKSYYLLYVFLFIFTFDLLIAKIEIIQATGKKTEWFHVVIYGIVCLMLLVWFLIGTYDYLFRRTWKNKISISKIDKISITHSDEGLETDVKLILKSKRYKLYKFRTHEKQVDSFVELLQSTNQNILLEN